MKNDDGRRARKSQRKRSGLVERRSEPETVENPTLDQMKSAVDRYNAFHSPNARIDRIEKRLTDYIMPDICLAGGISEMRKIANMAEIYYIPFAPHNNSSALSTVADAHVCASVPNFLVLEFHRYGDPIWNDVIISDEPAIQDGHVMVPDKPGIGVELNDEYLEKNNQEEGELWQ